MGCQPSPDAHAERVALRHQYSYAFMEGKHFPLTRNLRSSFRVPLRFGALHLHVDVEVGAGRVLRSLVHDVAPATAGAGQGKTICEVTHPLR